jgi:hypothetical protein
MPLRPFDRVRDLKAKKKRNKKIAAKSGTQRKEEENSEPAPPIWSSYGEYLAAEIKASAKIAEFIAAEQRLGPEKPESVRPINIPTRFIYSNYGEYLKADLRGEIQKRIVKKPPPHNTKDKSYVYEYANYSDYLQSDLRGEVEMPDLDIFHT